MGKGAKGLLADFHASSIFILTNRGYQIYLDKYTDHEWVFPKVHTHGHLFDEIELKGATRNTSTKPNERKHHSVKGNYGETNFKDVEYQVSGIPPAPVA